MTTNRTYVKKLSYRKIFRIRIGIYFIALQTATLLRKFDRVIFAVKTDAYTPDTILDTLNLIYFDDAVDLPDEPEASHEANGACEQEEQEHHDNGVTEVQEGGGGVFDVEFGDEVVAAVDEEVAGSGS